MLNNLPQLMGIYLFLPIWLVLGSVEIIHYISLWQLKSYRVDRFAVLFSLSTIKQVFLPSLLVPRLLYAAIAIIVLVTNTALVDKQVVFYALFFSELSIIFYGVFAGYFKKPSPTVRASAIALLAVFFDLFIFLKFAFSWPLILILPVVRFASVSLIVFITSIPRFVYVRSCVFLAKRKLSKYPNLIKIGITGSYGKTSTKTFLVHVLSKKYKVISTSENQNSDIGIARCILKSDLDSADILVIEMGAYGRGDIAFYCSFVKPSIGILTGINEQHAALMGNVERIKETKLALLKSLPTNGVAVFTIDTPHTEKIGLMKVKTVYTYGRDLSRKPEVLLASSDVNGQSVDCSFVLNSNKKIDITLPFPVPHYADNFCGALVVALHLGVSEEEIQEAAKSMPLPHHGIVVRSFGGNGVMILDYYNANPHGARAALEILQLQAGNRRKIVVTRGLVELGREGRAANEKFGALVAHCEAELVIIAPDEEIPLSHGFRNAGGNLYSTVLNPKDCIVFLRHIAKENVALLVENRVHPEIVKELYELR